MINIVPYTRKVKGQVETAQGHRWALDLPHSLPIPILRKKNEKGLLKEINLAYCT